MSLPSLVRLGPRTPENLLSAVSPQNSRLHFGLSVCFLFVLAVQIDCAYITNATATKDLYGF